MKSFFIGFIQNSLVKEIGLYVFVAAGVAFGLLYFKPLEAISSLPQKVEKKYETIHPEISPSFSTIKLIGRVNSNSFATIQPRREGLLKDILVDVGDRVRVGQTLASLFPPGVEGEGSSQIAKARAELVAAREELANAERVAAGTVEVSAKNLNETETMLRTTAQGGSVSDRSKLEQGFDNAETVAIQSMQNIQRILFGDDLSARSTATIVGNFNNTILKSDVFHEYQEVARLEKQLSDQSKEGRRKYLPKHLNQMNQLLDQMEALYRTENASGIHSETQISEHIQMIQENQSMILAAKDRLEDVQLEIDQLKTSVQTAEKDLSLSQSEAQLEVDAARNEVQVALAMYQEELSRSGHVTIISPFNGIITNRFFDVGQMVKPDDALFEITEIKTSLGQVSGKEVIFGLPEEWLAQMELGKKVEVILPTVQKKLPATISRRGQSVDAMSRTVSVHAVFDDQSQSIPHNTNVFVLLTNTEYPVFSVPSTSIKRKGNENFLWVLDEKENARHMLVQILAEDGEKSDIRAEGLQMDSKVISNPSASLWNMSTPWEPASQEQTKEESTPDSLSS